MRALMIGLSTLVVSCAPAPQNENTEPTLRMVSASHARGATSSRVVVDPETGCHYLFHKSGYGGGMALRVNRDGTPYCEDQPHD